MNDDAALRDQASDLLSRATALVHSCDARIFESWPCDRYVALLDDYPAAASLGYRNSGVRRACREIHGMAGDAGLEAYHQALLLTLILRSVTLLPQRDLPDVIRCRFVDNFARIVRNLEQQSPPSGGYLYSSSSFCKDLAICTLRLIPVGFAKVHVYRLPRRMFLANGLRGRLEAFRFAFLEEGGLGPYYDTHMHSEDPQALGEFGPTGWIDCFLRVGELLRRNPSVKGLIGTTWLYDPALEKISPHLAPIRTVQTDHGARLFSLGPCDAHGIGDATMKSASRRRLYDQGEYTPMAYLIVWPRKALIEWASTFATVSIGDGEHSPIDRSYVKGK